VPPGLREEASLGEILWIPEHAFHVILRRIPHVRGVEEHDIEAASDSIEYVTSYGSHIVHLQPRKVLPRIEDSPRVNVACHPPQASFAQRRAHGACPAPHFVEGLSGADLDRIDHQFRIGAGMVHAWKDDDAHAADLPLVRGGGTPFD
jgi:hypothetical protein